MSLQKIAAFSDGLKGGNPAGVWIGEALPPRSEMQRIAAEAGFSETVFATLDETSNRWLTRYFSPESEVPFCGHATIALGAALARQNGDGLFELSLSQAEITVEGYSAGSLVQAALQSPPTRSGPVPTQLLAASLALFGYQYADLDPQIPPALIHAGADHLVLALRSRELLAAMKYRLDEGRLLMREPGLVTIALVYAEGKRRMHTRNAFASGGVLEDPATGAATAALAGYLRDLQWPHGGQVGFVQGEDMGMRSLLSAQIGPLPGSSIRVSGSARWMVD